MQQLIIKTENLVKLFGDVIALDGLNLKVSRGISGFIGPNGAGKTTTINILIGLLKPDMGKAYIYGLDSWRDSYRIKQKLGVLHEDVTYPSNLTALKFLTYVAKLHKIKNPKQEALRMLKMIGLYNAQNRQIKGFSAGMLKKLGLAQALIGDPQLVILDEPTANLDPSARLSLLDLIQRLNNDLGVNFLISTHILAELDKVCSWVSIIRDGKIIEQGFMSDLKEKYSENIFKIEASNVEKFLVRLKEVDGIDNAWIENKTLLCKTRDVRILYEAAAKITSEENIFLGSIQPQYSTLESIYREVIMKDEENRSMD